jgi:hypothetical protein
LKVFPLEEVSIAFDCAGAEPPVLAAFGGYDPNRKVRLLVIATRRLHQPVQLTDPPEAGGAELVGASFEPQIPMVKLNVLMYYRSVDSKVTLSKGSFRLAVPPMN